MNDSGVRGVDILVHTATLSKAESAVPGLADEDAVCAAYSAYGAEIYRFALRELGDEGAAQELVEETFLRAWRSSHGSAPRPTSLRAWLFTLAGNAVRDRMQEAPVPLGRGGVVAPERAAGTGQDAGERLAGSWVVEQALRRLSEEHRTAIVQTHLRGRPYAEVAAELGVSVGTLRSQVFHGLKAVRVALDEMRMTP